MLNLSEDFTDTGAELMGVLNSSSIIVSEVINSSSLEIFFTVSVTDENWCDDREDLLNSSTLMCSNLADPWMTDRFGFLNYATLKVALDSVD